MPARKVQINLGAVGRGETLVDGVNLENSERCACRPVRLLDDEHGNRIYRHDPAVAY